MADIKDIELARPGKYNLAIGGEQEFTPAMLSDAANRAKEQGAKFRAPLKLGHTDPRNDGEPAMGWLHNLRVEADGVLRGDATGIPQWLADTAPSAYPDRSIEGHMVELGDGNKGLQIEALALLGVTPPAMASLKSWRELPGFIAAAADVPLTAFAAAYEALRDVPQELPAEPVEPIPDPKEADTMSDTLLKGLSDRLGIPAESDEAAVLSALDAKLTANAAPPAPTVETIAAAYKLTTDQVTTALAAAAAPPAPATGDLPTGTVAISKDALDELRIAAAAGAEARVIQLRTERDETIGAAVAAGKIAPARREHWSTNWDKDPEGTKAGIASLEAVYPVAASGYAGGNGERADDELSADEEKEMTRMFGALDEGALNV